MGADPVKTHGNFTPSHFLPPRAPQTASFVLFFSLCFFFPRIQTYVGAEGAEACRFFPMLLGVAHGPHVMPMLRLMGTIGNLRARPSGGGRRGVVLAKEIKVCLGMNKG